MTVAVIVSLLLGLAGLGFGLWDLHKFNALNGSVNSTLKAAVDNSVPATSIVLPSAGATVSGSVGLDTVPIGPNIKAVEFFVTGGSSHNVKIGDGNLRLVGWVLQWNSANLPNGAYVITSVGFSTSGKSSRSAGVNVTVHNP